MSPVSKCRNASEQETREKGLKTEITEENKGFQMLAKLGYKYVLPYFDSAASGCLKYRTTSYDI